MIQSEALTQVFIFRGSYLFINSEMRRAWICRVFFAFFLIFSSNTLLSTCPQRSYEEPSVYPATLDLSATWTIHHDYSNYIAVLQRDNFFCGFLCTGNCTSYLFAIFINVAAEGYYYQMEPIWSANRDHPVREGAILNFTAAGELLLQDVDGSIVWTTNTTRKSVAGMNLTDDGNLMLFDGHNSMVWQSFDHPTDSLVPGQKLFPEQKLIPSVSSTNWTAQKDLYSLQVTNEGLFGYVGSNPPQKYYSYVEGISYLELIGGGREYDYLIFSGPNGWKRVGIDPPFPPQYIKVLPGNSCI